MILAASEMLSPFASELAPTSEAVMTLPPSRCMAASKDSLVRVLGSKNRLAIILPRQRLYCPGMLSAISSARENKAIISPLERSSMVTRFLFFRLMVNSPSPVSPGPQLFLQDFTCSGAVGIYDSHLIAAVGF